VASPQACAKLVHVEDVAELLRTSPKGIYTMVERGTIPGVFRIGRRVLFRRDALLRWIEGDVPDPTRATASGRGGAPPDARKPTWSG